jgi:hypothetical protein
MRGASAPTPSHYFEIFGVGDRPNKTVKQGLRFQFLGGPCVVLGSGLHSLFQ